MTAELDVTPGLFPCRGKHVKYEQDQSIHSTLPRDGWESYGITPPPHTHTHTHTYTHLTAPTDITFLNIILLGETAGKEDILSDDPSPLEQFEESKRPGLMRYGRGSVLRYGKRGTIFRYGKRGTIFRYGKRDDDTDTDLDSPPRVFRYGKRDDENYKRVFRWGKRSGDTEGVDDDIYRYDDKRGTLMRYGKRDSDASSDELEKRRLLRYGKRGSDETLEEIKRRIMRYGRDIRAPLKPHVPFRFGDEK